ncbi:MAG: hypothetical protein WCE94_00135 [Candidatus Methanoperedens sp.]
MRYARKESHDIADESELPVLAVGKEKENGLTPRQKKFMEETMDKHDKALKKLSREA